ncbi:FG-GAP-like repeat-containing protein [Mucilaginibacter aquariorum]|uniref:FG-GAP-like repeat-containing protein n=1 Tax=Mucilaginibacter aquariorum TaxID=2967225 RepID=A0ABT1SXV5_9SPHI|nr:FG-GAP-like repeat-containing protein [Mucilaginibacter aquariorum]MCQ6957182.1 FG-GAP-like repeat-containing protein [Mucilaginibacter aquariorum]
MIFLKKAPPYLTRLIFLSAFILYGNYTCAQFRQLHVEPDENHALKLSFYSGGEGYVAFTGSVGFTTDSGKTFQQKKITLNNVNYGDYNVNLTFGFGILGVKAFDQNNILVYGHYGLVPAILRSADGGATFKVVYHDQYSVVPNSAITDMVFPENKNTGYAVDNDRILKTVNGGQNWAVSYAATNNNFIAIQALNNTQLIAFGAGGQLFRTADGGATWQQIAVQGSYLRSVYFLNTTIGWSGDNEGNVYYTVNAGASWAKQNTIMGTALTCYKLKFVNDSTGYALTNGFNVYKTSDRGKIWEPLPRDNNYAYLGYTLNDFQFNGNTVWTAGGHGQIQVSSNGGGTPIPKALFTIDTAGAAGTGQVKLQNLSKTGNSYRWQVNGKEVSKAYNVQYTHNIFSTYDTVRLIVSNKQLYADTLTRYQAFKVPVLVTGFSPVSGIAGTRITITGFNFKDVYSVTIGGVAVTSYTVVSPTSIIAVAGKGASGKVVVTTYTGSGSKAGFTYISPPLLAAISPAVAGAGDMVTLTGSGFNHVTAVSFGGTAAGSFTIVSATQIKAIVSSGAAGDVKVVSPAGVSSIPGFTMIPAINGFTPDKGTNGTLLNLTGTGLSNVTEITVGGVPVRSFVVNSATSITAVAAANAQGVVKVSAPGGYSTSPGTFKYYATPVIRSFAPLTGPVGTELTIKGANFDPVAAQNTVYIGLVKIPVITASATTLTVRVPAGIAYEPITVTAHNLQSYSAQPFTLTFTGGGSITSKSFVSDTTSLALNSAGGTRMADMDGDSRADIISYSPVSSSLMLSRNTGSNGTTSFEQLDLSALVGKLFYYTIADLDGDGLPDLVARNASQVIAFRNTSSPGKVSFQAVTVLAAVQVAWGVVVHDMDSDGKPDVVVSQIGQFNGTAILRNKGEPGSISFYGAEMIYWTNQMLKDIVNDFDQDGKPDLMGQLPDFGENFFILKNDSEPGVINIPASGLGDWKLGSSRGVPTLSDVDNDGKMDVIVAYPETHKISVYRNISAAGVLQFENKTDLGTTDPPADIISNDLDGDGRPEIILTYYNRKSISIFKNISSGGKTAFSLPVEIATSGIPTGIITGDVNNDGKNDMLYTSGGNKLAVLLNVIKPVPFIAGFTPGSGISGTQVKISGINFTGTTAVKFGGIAAGTFTLTGDTLITAIPGAGASGEVSVTNSYGTSSLPGFVYGLPPVITSVSPLSGPAGTPVVISGSNFDPVPDKNIVYFGDVKGTVTAASATSLTVSAPAQATYKPISVATHNFIASSALPFSVTYPNGFKKFDAQAFNVRQYLPGRMPFAADLDGDGKPDLVYTSGSAAEDLMVARNLTAAGADTALFDTPKVIAPGLIYELSLQFTDINADGKLDIIFARRPALGAPSSGTMYLLLNNSTLGRIGFLPLINLNDVADSPNFDTYQMATIKDIDGDGLPDLVTSGFYTSVMSVYRNISASGNLHFGQRTDFTIPLYAFNQAHLSDMDGDGRPDLLVITSGGENLLSVYKNNSTKGQINFAPRLTFPIEGQGFAMSVADVDGDHIPDVVLADGPTEKAAVLRNMTKATGGIKFASTFIGKGLAIGTMVLADLNGDAKPDILAGTTQTQLMLLKNSSTAGDPVFNDDDIYYAPGVGDISSVADMDMDGRPDILAYYGNRITIMLNKTKPPLNLPGKNLRAEFVSATCKGANNGTINITAASQQNYYVTINKLGFGTSKKFTKTLLVTGLAPGEYNVCITVDGYPDFQQCFTGTITEPRDLAVYTAVDPSSRNVVLSLSGGSSYRITLNDTRLETSEQRITLALHNGNNQLQVSTDKDCQGVFSKMINVGGKITPYPNPFTNLLQIDIAGSTALTAGVEVIDAFGKSVIKQTVKPGNGTIALDVSGLQSGVYVLRLLLDNKPSVYKIWKR